MNSKNVASFEEANACLEAISREKKFDDCKDLWDRIEYLSQSTDISALLAAKILDPAFPFKKPVAGLYAKCYPNHIEDILRQVDLEENSEKFTNLVFDLFHSDRSAALGWAMSVLDALADTTDHTSFDSLCLFLEDVGDKNTAEELFERQRRTGYSFYGSLAEGILAKLKNH